MSAEHIVRLAAAVGALDVSLKVRDREAATFHAARVRQLLAREPAEARSNQAFIALEVVARQLLLEVPQCLESARSIVAFLDRFGVRKQSD